MWLSLGCGSGDEEKRMTLTFVFLECTCAFRKLSLSTYNTYNKYPIALDNILVNHVSMYTCTRVCVNVCTSEDGYHQMIYNL